MTKNKVTEWEVFYQALNRLGPRFLEGVHPDLEEWINYEASETENFWSDGFHSDFDLWAEGSRTYAVKNAFETWTDRVKHHLREILGHDSLIPFKKYGITEPKRSLWINSIGNIRLRLDDKKLKVFIDSVSLDYAKKSDIPMLLLQGILTPYDNNPDGKLVHALVIPWQMIIKNLKKDWCLASQIPYEKWEEMVAAAYDRAGYDEVILTPRSGDHGRDVIAIKKGVGSVKIINSVKAYKPGHLVKHDDVRALAGVLNGDLQASKGIVMTTSDFAPGITKDPYLKPLMPYRLELMNGKALQKWMEDIAFS